MSLGSVPPDPTPHEDAGSFTRAANLGYAAIAGQAGCFTLAIILIALIVGIWLDAQFGRRGPFTIGLLLLSVPFSLFVMVRIALGAVKQITPSRRDPKQDSPEEDNR